VDIDAQDDFGNSTLHLAMASSHREYIKCLVQNGANLKLKNNEGRRYVLLTLARSSVRRMCRCRCTSKVAIKLMAERMNLNTSETKWKNQHSQDVKAHLPTEISELQELCSELLIHQCGFEARCKVLQYLIQDAFRQALEGKHVALYKVQLLEVIQRLRLASCWLRGASG
jgi:hypothetical protein